MREQIRNRLLGAGLAALLLAGCGAQTPEQVREHWEAVSGFETHVEVLADNGSSVQTYGLDYRYRRDGVDHLTLTAPEAVAGIEADYEEGQRFVVQYGETALDDGLPVRQGVAPADCVPWLVRELREGVPLESWRERVNGVEALVLRYECSEGSDTILRQLWLDRTRLTPLCAEVYVNGSRVLLVTFSGFTEA